MIGGAAVAGLTRELVAVAERVAIVTPLGIRFWDLAEDAAIRDGLEVVAWPVEQPRQTRLATRTRSGVYAFHGLPGLHAVEYPAAADAAAASPPLVRRFMVQVRDTLGRFLPAVFGVDAPYRGIYPTETISPLTGRKPPGFYLFSAPTRPAGSALAVARAQLVDALTDAPAAFAVLEVETPGPRTWYGIADARGMVAALFPYPTFRGPLGAESPPVVPAPPRGQRWVVTARVRYAPAALVVPPGAALPELRSIFAQPPSLVWPALDGGSAPASQLTAELSHGAALILRTTPRAELIVGQLTSPP
jgi:hypothetical protein